MGNNSGYGAMGGHTPDYPLAWNRGINSSAVPVPIGAPFAAPVVPPVQAVAAPYPVMGVPRTTTVVSPLVPVGNTYGGYGGYGNSTTVTDVNGDGIPDFATSRNAFGTSTTALPGANFLPGGAYGGAAYGGAYGGAYGASSFGAASYGAALPATYGGAYGATSFPGASYGATSYPGSYGQGIAYGSNYPPVNTAAYPAPVGLGSAGQVVENFSAAGLNLPGNWQAPNYGGVVTQSSAPAVGHIYGHQYPANVPGAAPQPFAGGIAYGKEVYSGPTGFGAPAY